MLTKTHEFKYLIILSVAGMVWISCTGSGAWTPPTAAVQKNSDAPRAEGIQPCKILTSAQVAMVLPNHDNGMVTDSGDSIMKGVKSYGCSYVNQNANLLTVVISIAENAERFSWISPSEGSHRNDRKIEVGDHGWVYGDSNDLKAEVVQGLAVIDLKLVAPGAQAKSVEMIELARVIARAFRK